MTFLTVEIPYCPFCAPRPLHPRRPLLQPTQDPGVWLVIFIDECDCMFVVSFLSTLSIAMFHIGVLFSAPCSTMYLSFALCFTLIMLVSRWNRLPSFAFFSLQPTHSSRPHNAGSDAPRRASLGTSPAWSQGPSSPLLYMPRYLVFPRSNWVINRIARCWNWPRCQCVTYESGDLHHGFASVWPSPPSCREFSLFYRYFCVFFSNLLF